VNSTRSHGSRPNLRILLSSCSRASTHDTLHATARPPTAVFPVRATTNRWGDQAHDSPARLRASRSCVRPVLSGRLRHLSSPPPGRARDSVALRTGISLRSSYQTRRLRLCPEPVLVTEPDSPPSSRSGPACRRPRTAQTANHAAKPATIPNARKGYKLTLWVSATGRPGVSDVNGLLQLDGATVPFCVLKRSAIRSLERLQEAYVAIERVRASLHDMAAPSAGPRRRTRVPKRSSGARATGGGQAPSFHASTSMPAALLVLRQRRHPTPTPRDARPRSQQARSLRTGSCVWPELGSRDRSRNGHCRPRLHKSRCTALPHRLSALVVLMQEVAHA